MYKAKFNSPCGELLLIASDKGLKEIKAYEGEDVGGLNQILVNAIKQLEDYFFSDLTQFSLPLDIEGTEYQQRCWEQLQNIPYGETISYEALAIRVADKNHVRSVANANNKNKLPIIIPCHRVIGKDGSLVGFVWGLELKQYLIDLEAKKKVPS